MLFFHTPQVEWLRERVDNLSQELVLARRDSSRLAKQLKVHLPPADVVCATPDPYRYPYTVYTYYTAVLSCLSVRSYSGNCSSEREAKHVGVLVIFVC